MKKVFTLFCALMVCVLFSGVANAQSPVVFQTSSKPTSTGFAENTHWYIMKLDDKFVTIENVDDANNIKLTADNTLTNTDITSGADRWCIVGDATNGYKFYNQKAGVDKVFGIKNININENEGGDARTQMYASTTTHSTDNNGVGTLFDIKTKDNVNNVYYVSLKGTTNRYWNQRDNYVSYWIHNDAYGNSGSKVRFYEADSYWTDYWATIDYTAYENIATQMEALVGTAPFTYPETAVNAFKNAITEAKTFKPTDHISIYKASSFLKDAKLTLRKSINGPTNNYVCKIKNPILGRFIHASTNWTAGSTFPLNNSDNERDVVFVIEKNKNGTYKIKSGDTGMYIKEASTYTSTASKEDATDFVIYGSQDCNNKVVIGTGDDFNVSKWFHANGGNLFEWVAEAPNSYWEFTPLDDAAVNALADARDREISSALLIPGVKEALAISDTYTNTSLCKTAESWETYKTAVLAKLPDLISNKYYRINNARTDVNLLATDGGNKPKMYKAADGKKLVSSLWKITLSGNKLKLSNVNNPGKYIATLTNATNNAGKTANDFTDEANAVQFTISRQGKDWFTLRDQNNNIFNGENLGNCPVNYWNGGLGTEGAKWQITEVTSLDVDLHTAADVKSYASVYLPFSVSSVTGARAYVAKDPETTTVTFSETEEGVKAQNGFLLISETGEATARLNIGESNMTSAMGGTLLDLTLNDADKAKYRVFGQKKSDETVIGFFKPSAALNTISANRAFFTNATGEALRLNFDGVVSGIETTELNNALNNNAPIYDLSGRRVMNAVKGGLYIQNGRKFIVK